MKLLTNALTATLIASSALIPTPANAWDVCKQVGTLYLCANPGQTYDVIQLNGSLPDGSEARERFHVQCITDGGWRYVSSGTLTKKLASDFVEGYCGGRGSVHPRVAYPEPNSSRDPETRDMTGRMPSYQPPQAAPQAPQPAPAPAPQPKDGFLF